jgi:hypothetical protein
MSFDISLVSGVTGFDISLSSSAPPTITYGKIKVGGSFVDIVDRKFKTGGTFVSVVNYKVKIGGTFVSSL